MSVTFFSRTEVVRRHSKHTVSWVWQNFATALINQNKYKMIGRHGWLCLSATYINWLEKVEHIDARSWTIWCMVRSTYTTDTLIYSATCRQVSRRRRGQFLADRVLSVTMTGGTLPIYGQPSRNILAFLAHAVTKRNGPIVKQDDFGPFGLPRNRFIRLVFSIRIMFFFSQQFSQNSIFQSVSAKFQQAEWAHQTHVLIDVNV